MFFILLLYGLHSPEGSCHWMMVITSNPMIDMWSYFADPLIDMWSQGLLAVKGSS